MTQARFSTRELKAAAKLVAASMAAALPEPAECTHTFSPAFEEKMARLCEKAAKRERRREVLHGVAAAFLILLLGLGLWLGVDGGARASFLRWVRETYDRMIVYRFEGEASETALPDFRPGWLPEGYEEVDAMITDTMCDLYFVNESTGKGIVFGYQRIKGGGASAIFSDTYETVFVSGIKADFYPADENSATNNLMWADDKLGVFFFIDSSLDKSVMLHIAESIILVNSTK